MPTIFSCITGGCHAKGETDGHHRDVGGYSYESNACYRCHQGGGGG
jgi:hypothetical protein